MAKQLAAGCKKGTRYAIMSVVVVGNPVDGITIHGPFDDPNTANEWADIHCRGDEWWVVSLVKPKPEKKWYG